MTAYTGRSLQLPADLVDRLADRAASENKSIDQLVEDAVRAQLEAYPRSGSEPGDHDALAPEYWGFISYSHADDKIGRWVHRALERYRIPKPFARSGSPVGLIPKRLKPFFRDQDEFAASADLGELINRALARSRYLIVICSPSAAKSKWVNQEIARFRRGGGARRVLCLIAAGEPHAAADGRPDAECFPPALFATIDGESGTADALEPLAADIRQGHDRRSRAIVRLVAEMIGAGFDALWRRDRRRRRNQIAVRTTTAVLILGMSIVAVQRTRIAEAESRINALMAAYEAESDPLIKVQLASEMPDDAESPRRLAWLHDAARLRPPLVEFSGISRFAAFSPDGRAAVTASDNDVRLSASDGTGPVTPLRGHTGSIWDVAFTPDGRSVVTASSDNTVRLWDAKTGALQGTLSGHQSAVYTVSVSNDSKVLVSGSHDHTARIWRLDGSRPPIVLIGHQGGVGVVAISPDGSLIATGSVEIMDNTVRIWTVDGAPLHVLTHGGLIRRLSFSPDGRQLLSVSDDLQVHVWTLADGSERVIEGGGIDASFSPDGRQVVTSLTDVRVHDLTSDAKPLVFEPRAGSTRFVRFSPDGSQVVAASDDGQLRVWPLKQSWNVTVLSGGAGNPLVHASFDRDGRRLLASGYIGPARLWNLTKGVERIDVPSRLKELAAAVVSSSDAGAVAAVFESRTIDVYSLEGYRATFLRTVRGIDATFTADGSRLLVVGPDGVVTEWQLPRLDSARTVGSGWRRVISHASFRKHGTLVVDRVDHAAVWRVDGTEHSIGPIELLAHRGTVETVAIGPAGPVMIVRSPNSVSLYRGTGWIGLGNPSPVPHAEFDHTGSRFATAGPNLTLEVRSVDRPTDAVTPNFTSRQLEATATAFPSAGESIAAGFMLGSVQVASFNGTDPLVLHSPRDRIDEVAFSSNGRRLVASTRQEGFSIWPMWWTDLLQLIRTETTACLSASNRERLLREAPSRAQAAFNTCESRHGRNAQHR